MYEKEPDPGSASKPARPSFKLNMGALGSSPDKDVGVDLGKDLANSKRGAAGVTPSNAAEKSFMGMGERASMISRSPLNVGVKKFDVGTPLGS